MYLIEWYTIHIIKRGWLENPQTSSQLDVYSWKNSRTKWKANHVWLPEGNHQKWRCHHANMGEYGWLNLNLPSKMVGSSNNYIPVTEHRKGLPSFGVFPLHCSTSGGVKLPWVKPHGIPFYSHQHCWHQTSWDWWMWITHQNIGLYSSQSLTWRSTTR